MAESSSEKGGLDIYSMEFRGEASQHRQADIIISPEQKDFLMQGDWGTKVAVIALVGETAKTAMIVVDPNHVGEPVRVADVHNAPRWTPRIKEFADYVIEKATNGGRDTKEFLCTEMVYVGFEFDLVHPSMVDGINEELVKEGIDADGLVARNGWVYFNVCDKALAPFYAKLASKAIGGEVRPSKCVTSKVSTKMIRFPKNMVGYCADVDHQNREDFICLVHRAVTKATDHGIHLAGVSSGGVCIAVKTDVDMEDVSSSIYSEEDLLEGGEYWMTEFQPRLEAQKFINGFNVAFKAGNGVDFEVKPEVGGEGVEEGVSFVFRYDAKNPIDLCMGGTEALDILEAIDGYCGDGSAVTVFWQVLKYRQELKENGTKWDDYVKASPLLREHSMLSEITRFVELTKDMDLESKSFTELRGERPSMLKLGEERVRPTMEVCQRTRISESLGYMTKKAIEENWRKETFFEGLFEGETSKLGLCILSDLQVEQVSASEYVITGTFKPASFDD